MPPRARSFLWLRFATAWGVAGLVIALGLLTVSPWAHARLHGAAHLGGVPCEHEHPAGEGGAATHDEAGCVVSVFAQGLPAAELSPRALPPRRLAAVVVPLAPSALMPPAPARLLPPAQAPPGFVLR